ncbi:MAG: hemolysin III family protein [Hyphomicrobiales bacterium]|nr:hemolysin III family protein [Hyphomicrobiales bacterium]
MFPIYSRAERIADAVVHLAGIVLCISGAIALHFAAIGRIPFRDLAGLSVYSAGMVSMFTASASYHLISRPYLKEWLRCIDHSAIFVMIAGSYTPFALKIGGATGMIILAAVWVIAAVGIGVKLLFPRRFDQLSIALYLTQGWCVVLAMGPLMDTLSDASFNLLLFGGVVYSAGVIFHLLERMPFHNVIWHVFVLAGAALQYASIYAAVIP